MHEDRVQPPHGSRQPDDGERNQQMAISDKNDIPWLDVVRFHKEIVERNEESFFSLNPRDSHADRWSSLSGFDLEEDDGPWRVPKDSISSKNFWPEYEQGRLQSVYLGGPCSFYEQRDFGKELPRWRPLLYREVELLKERDGSISIRPKQDSWNFASWFFRLFDRMQIQPPDSFDELLDELLKKIEGEADRDAAIQTFLANKYPAMEERISRRIPPGTFDVEPSSWVLFATTDRFSPFIRNLHKDYESLEGLLEEDSGNIGGLGILQEPSWPDDDEDAPVLPVIEMNEAQEEAVSHILQKRPLTVISGPPGTGKSQVVVSLLLNAWARGLSVLFTSNNNNAVDVVRERILEYQGDFPIAVRAGSQARQNIQEVLDQVLDLAMMVQNQGVAKTDPAKRKKQRDALRGKLNELEELREVSSLINEDHNAFLKALHTYERQSAELKELEESFEEQKRELGIDNLSVIEIKKATEEAREWLEKAGSYRGLAEEDEKRRKSLREQIAEKEKLRDDAAGKLGLTATDVDSWDWLLPPSPDAGELKTWEKKIRAAVGDCEDALHSFEWKPVFERWMSAEDSSGWSAAAREFLAEVRSACRELKPKIEALQRLEDSRNEAWKRINSQGTDEDIVLSTKVLRSWATAYAELATRQPARLDFLPWSKRSALRRQLRKIETILRPAFSLEIWTRIGPLDTGGRQQLAPVVEATIRWLELREKWDGSKPERDEIEARFGQIRQAAKDLELNKIPPGQKPEAWEPIVEQCEELVAIAERATTAWKKKKEKEKAEKRLRAVSSELLELVERILLLEAWCKHRGVKFHAAIKSLNEAPSISSIEKVKSILKKNDLPPLMDTWEACLEHEKAAAALREEYKSIRSLEARIGEWWVERPAHEPVSGVEEQPDSWPNIDEPIGRIGRINDWCERYTEFIDDAKPGREEKAGSELDRAKEKSRSVLEHLPKGSEKTKAKAIYDQLFQEAAKNAGRLIEELDKLLMEFRPERLEAKISKIAKELEEGSFDDAKNSFLERLASAQDAVKAVDNLRNSLRASKGKLAEKDYGEFKKALELIPVWITTAQSPQAIPLEPGVFDIVVIDEASQCTFTNLLPLMYRGKTLVIIGDIHQLSAIPTISENEERVLALKHGITAHLNQVGHATNNVYNTATQALPQRRGDVKMLTEHFRSHPLIIGFSNRYIYQQTLVLKKNPSEERERKHEIGVIPRGGGGVARRGPTGSSWINQIEAERVLEVMTQELRPLITGRNKLSLGIVTPFRAQKELIRKLMESEALPTNILVDTAHGFQGDERDIIIFSPVVSQQMEPNTVSWVERPPNMINVALTRAKEALYIVADLNYLSDRNSILSKLAEYCADIDKLRRAGGARVELYSWMVVQGWTPDAQPSIEADFLLENQTTGARLAVIVMEEDEEKDQGKDTRLRSEGCDVEWVETRDILETPHNVIHTIGAALA